MFIEDSCADSLRAIEKCKHHPGKMWVVRGKRMQPLLPFSNGTTPWHSSQYAVLPEIYVQDASLEMAWSRVALEQHSISGEEIIPFVSQNFEGFDINEPEELGIAERLLATHDVNLPKIDRPSYNGIENTGV